jgi:hypothetical protein
VLLDAPLALLFSIFTNSLIALPGKRYGESRFKHQGLFEQFVPDYQPPTLRAEESAGDPEQAVRGSKRATS